MAPTICSEKKPRQIRNNLKEIRRQQNLPSSLLSSMTGGGNGNSNFASNMIDCAVTRSISTLNQRTRGGGHLEISSVIDRTSLKSMRMNRLHLALNREESSDNIVSSSTNGLEMFRAGITAADQMDIDNDVTTDDDDCEVHSITSGAQCNNNSNYNNNNNNTTVSNSRTNNNCHKNNNMRQFVNCYNNKIIFPASTTKTTTTTTTTQITTSSIIDKQATLLTIANANNNNNNNNKNNNHNNYINNNNEKKRKYDAYNEKSDSSSCISIDEIKNTEGLLAIALKTIKLVKRNQMLQRRLTQLQLETSEFIESVLANPENRHFRDKMHSPASSLRTPSAVSSSSSSSSSSSLSSSSSSLSTSTMSSPVQSPTTTTTTTTILKTTRQHSQSVGEV